MPKIVINEYDKTKAGTSAYANFSVVVPGFLGDYTATDDEVKQKFDENDIYECDSQADFLKYVGPSKYKLTTKAEVSTSTAPTVSVAIRLDSQLSAPSLDDDSAGYFSYTLDGQSSGLCVYSIQSNNTYNITCSTSDGFSNVVTAWHGGVSDGTTNKYFSLPETLEDLKTQLHSIFNIQQTDTTGYEIVPSDEDLSLDADLITTFKEVNETDEQSLSEGQIVVGVYHKAISADSYDLVPGNDIRVSLGQLRTPDDASTFEVKYELTPIIGSDEKPTGFYYCSEELGISSLEEGKFVIRVQCGDEYRCNKLYSATNRLYFGVEVDTVLESLGSLVGSGKNYTTYTAEANEANLPAGYLVDENYKYSPALASGALNLLSVQVAHNEPASTLVIDSEKAWSKWSQSAYYIIKNSDCGISGQMMELETVHYGNQIAYELLGLGYTVLFKKITHKSLEDTVLDLLLENATDKESFLASIESAKVDNTTWSEFIKQQYLSLTTAIDSNDQTKLKYVEEETIKDSTGNAVSTVYKIKAKFTAIQSLSDATFWECLKDKATYDFRYIVTGLLDYNTDVNKQIVKLAEAKNDSTEDGRGDCIALLDIGREIYCNTGVRTQSEAASKIAEESATILSGCDGKYAAIFAPTVTYIMPEDETFANNRTFPGSFHYLACAAKAFENYSEWYAVAGFTRGVSNYSIETTGFKFGEAAIQALEPRNSSKGVERAVNLIVKIKNGYYLWGNRTACRLNGLEDKNPDLVASHFLNIRQLCTTIKKQVYTACRRFTFDPNSQVLWLNFCSAIRPTLETMKSDQGIRDYKIVQTISKQKGVLSAKIRIVPIEAVEDFYINLYLEDSISGPDAQVSETE